MLLQAWVPNQICKEDAAITHDKEDGFIESLDLESQCFSVLGPVVDVDQIQQRRVDEGLNLDAWLVEQSECQKHIE